MNINQAFPSKWLSATDLGQAKPVVVISGVTSEAINQNEPPKLVIHFQGKQKGMVLNKTNAMNIATMYGPETEAWTGKAITLYTTFVDFQGKSVLALRVEPQIPQAQGSVQQPQVQQTAGAGAMPTNDPNMPPAMPPEGPDDLDDEIPW